MARILYPTDWQDYELIDTGNRQRFERFGTYKLVRPDPTATWSPTLSQSEWDKADARFISGQREIGTWEVRGQLPESWEMHWRSLTFTARCTPAKHTGVFPEHAVQWGWMQERIERDSLQRSEPIRVLNLFGYTGLASLACASAGAHVTHIESSYATLGWARDNQARSGLAEATLRWIREDVSTFVAREVKRGNHYDAIVLDPPAYGHGPKGEIWSAPKMLPELLQSLVTLLSHQPLFVLLNSYATGTGIHTLESQMKPFVQKHNGLVHSGELGLKQSSNDRILTTGSWVVWEKERTL